MVRRGHQKRLVDARVVKIMGHGSNERRSRFEWS